MRLLAPASNFNDARDLLLSGADDIYIAADSEIFSSYSFSGRAKLSRSGKHVLADSEELKRIANLVHSKNGCLHFLANTPFLHDSFDVSNNIFLEEFIKYIDCGISAGVDYIVLADIGAIKLVRDRYPGIGISASSYLEVQNEWAAKMLEQFDVDQAILSYQCSLEEIRDICAKSKMKIEVFGHGGCSFYVGSCNMFHELGERKINMGYPCRAQYEVSANHKNFGFHRVLDCFKMCSLCNLKELDNYNVHALKIVGRDLSSSYILQIVKIYKMALEFIESGKPLAEIFQCLPVWWRKAWCEQGNLCRYKGGL